MKSSLSFIHPKIKVFLVALLMLMPLAAAFAPASAFAQTATPATPAANTAFAAVAGNDCTAISISSLGPTCIMNDIGYAIFELVNGLLAIVGWFFNIAVEKTVFQFGSYFGTSAGLLAGWGVLRDVANIALLFGFIFMGIATILDIHGYEVKKTLPRLIIFAVLLNFSLLASTVIIDTSNLFASVLYGQTGNCSTGDQSTCGRDQGISGMIMGDSGAGSVFNIQDEPTSPGFIFYMGLSIFGVILMVVLLAGAILLVTRGVVLVFLMVLSPIGFAGLAIPPLEKYAKMWWDKLLTQSFFAPIFLLLMFVGLKIGSTLNGTGSLAGALANGSAGGIDEILIFALMIGFTVGALMIAKQMGAMGANFATSFARQTVTYPFAFVGRHTVNRGGSAGVRVWNTAMGRMTQSKSGVVRNFASALRKTGIDEGVHGAFNAAATTKIGGIATLDERRKLEAARKSESVHAADKAENDAKLKQALKDIGDPAKKDAAEKAIADITQKMSLHDLEIAVRDGSDAQVEALGKAMSPDKFEKLMDSKEVTADKQHQLQHARFAGVDETNVKNLVTKDLEQLAKADTKRFAELLEKGDAEGKSYLKEDQLEALVKSDRISPQQRQLARANTIVGRVEAHIEGGRTADAGKLAAAMNPKEKAKLASKYITDPAVMATFTPTDMNTLLSEKKVKDPDVVINWLKKSATPTQRTSINTYLAKNDFDASLWGADSI